MIQIKDKRNCCACEACVNICPQKCISMKEDEDGFLYPVVDKDKCIDCGICDKVCQYENSEIDLKRDDEIEVYSCVIKNKENLKDSSTVAVFYNLAKYIIEHKGIVYGAKFSEEMEVIHTRVDNIEELDSLRGSKYIQSKMGETYSLVKKDLLNNKTVLFSGTPCQVGGLYKYLGKNYENLITIDIICFGVPSPKIFKDYIKEKEKEYNSKVIYANFRDKTKGWGNMYTRLKFEDENITYFVPSEQDEWYIIFRTHISTRESCNNCLYTSLYRKADITLGDFWGIEKIDKNLERFNGVGKVILNTKKGKELFKNIVPEYEIKKRKLEDAIRPNLQHPPERNKHRDKFFEIYRDKGYKKAAQKAYSIRKNQTFKDRMRWKVVKIIRIIKGRK